MEDCLGLLLSSESIKLEPLLGLDDLLSSLPQGNQTRSLW